MKYPPTLTKISKIIEFGLFFNLICTLTIINNISEKMAVSVSLMQTFTVPNPKQLGPWLLSNNQTLSSCRRKLIAVRCAREAKEREGESGNYYELLGVSGSSSAQQIKDAYRKLQKIHHPDIAGQEGHELTLMLNKAYEVLMSEDLRRGYDTSIGYTRFCFDKETTNLSFSSWNGPLRSEALFVDENTCVGCQECVHHASKTFVMDETLGCARVRVQFGDDDTTLTAAVDSCPVNCIHWVKTEEVEVLEYLMQPRPKEGYGIFGHGWERPKNVFMAAKSFNNQTKNSKSNAHRHQMEETPAQAQARADASKTMHRQSFSTNWTWLIKNFFRK
ncbi:chaperone [Lithospermum erythrorhizon]|uniref:Chaperone n=1 Tax=Lithospermum erythrorhizon TaxID=34254 RepID=A0AAV3QL22_LITER